MTVNELLLAKLIGVRRTGEMIGELPPEARVTTLDGAYATADALAVHIGRPVAGWKIGASVARGQDALGLDEPFGGRVFADTVHESGAEIRPLLATLTIGAEFTCRVGRDLGVDERFEAQTIGEVVDRVYPSLELNQVSYADPMGVGGLCITADNGFNAGLVLGEPVREWDMEVLKGLEVTFYLDGVEQSRGSAADIGFDPLEALAWLVNDRSERGDPLKAGQLVATGDLIGALEAERGQTVMADFGMLGRVEVRLS